MSVFENALSARLTEELAATARLGVVPIRLGEPTFEQVIGAGMINWVVSLAGELLGIPKFVSGEEVAHTILTAGAPVLAAGEAEIVGTSGQYLLLDLKRHSGHCRPDAASVRVGLRAFAAAGIECL